jgi:predicted HTH transcriptional regulator
MPRSSLRNLELSAVTEAVLRELIAEGETDMVERKAKPPKDGLGPTVASFANSGGGWILLGVANDGSLVGFRAPGRAEPQDWLSTALRKNLDPLPLFEAKATAALASAEQTARARPQASRCRR